MLFLLSAALSAWLAYDQTAGWSKYLLIVGGVAVYYSITQAPEKIYAGFGSHLLRLCMLLLPSVIAAYYLMTNDWLKEMGDPAWLDLPRRWLVTWQPDFKGYRLHPNQVGGIIAAFVPLQVFGLGARKHSRLLSWVAVPLLSLSAVGLLLTGARGAWLALAMIAVSWVLCLLHRRLASRGSIDPPPPLSNNLRFVILVLGGLVIFLALLLTPSGDWLQGIDNGRVNLWHNSLDLAGDYPFSGLGLASYQMPFSSYVLLLHVGYLSHAHNLLLDLWLEQGLPGLLAFAWLLIAAVRPNQPKSYWRQPALTSLTIIFLHGLVDDAFYGYDGLGILLLFVPLALLVRPVARSGPASRLAATPVQPGPRLAPFLWPMLVLSALAGLLILPAWRAELQANLGALTQTRAELSVYGWPEWPIQDALRRSSEIDLTPALAHYRAALAQNPANLTANRRLGQIELSLGQYEAARQHLEAAYAVAPEQRATRQLLGESYAVAGEVDQAATLWRSVEMGQSQLSLRQWWYDHIGESQRAVWIEEGAQ
jgi:tetratricopeptide (TPR) repeat protein